MLDVTRKGFTLIELIVVATIIGLLAGSGAVAYTQFSRQSRDAKRKADIEQIRAAIELYKSHNNTYPTSINLTTCTPTPASLTDDDGNTYLSKIPNDPKCDTYVYSYSSDGSTYTIAAYLETGSGSCGGVTCGGTTNCNYCVGPYGEE